MASDCRTNSFRMIARVFDDGVLTGVSDAELVERFATTRDAEAFAAIVGRHGPRLMALCQGLLGSRGDADDAFQATFLILMNRAGTFSVGESLTGWLCRVAQRVVRQARLADARRRKRDLAAGWRGDAHAQCPVERSEIVRLVRQEIDRLPERYRSPIMLCDLQGMTRDDAALVLGWPQGTVGGRLARGAGNFVIGSSRGLAPSVTITSLGETGIRADGWLASIETVIRNASSLAAGSAPTPEVLALVSGVGRGFAGAVGPSRARRYGCRAGGHRADCGARHTGAREGGRPSAGTCSGATCQARR